MPSNSYRKCLSIMLALLVIFSTIPVSVFATETTEADNTAETFATAEQKTNPSVTEPISTEASTTPAEATMLSEEQNGAEVDDATFSAKMPEDSLSSIMLEMDTILLEHLGKTVMSEEEVLNAVNAMFWDDMQSALDELNALEAEFSPLSEEDIAQLEEHYAGADTIVWFYETLQLAMTPSVFAATSGTHTPVTGVTVGVSGATDNSMSSGTITVTAKGSAGFLGIGASAKTATITVYNESGSRATISFGWTASSVNELKIDGTKYTGTSGSFSKTLDADASFTITITTAKNATTNTLKLNNFSVAAVQDESKVTFIYTAGDVTVAGTSVGGSGKFAEISSEGADVVTTGSNFIAWVNDADNKIVSTTANFKLQPESDMTIRALFGPTACFQIGAADASGYMFDDLNKAAAFAATSASPSKTIVLANDGTLPVGDYSIPTGVTLLVPFDDAHTLHSSSYPNSSLTQDYKKPSVYRTMTMASGASITVNGAISLSSTIHGANGGERGGGSPSVSTSMIKMEDNASITVGTSGALYAYGYITGNGTIVAKGSSDGQSGATIYECFQIEDFRGGTETSGMTSGNGVFPLSQYYVQNIEVPLTIETGAQEIGFTALYMSIPIIGGSFIPSPVNFIGGSNAMFNLTSGSVTKQYDGSTDRLIVDLDGTMVIKNLALQVARTDIDSKDYDLPINSNLSITINSGSSVNVAQDIAMLPGAEMYIEEKATLTVNSGYNVYVYDADQWGTYCGAGKKTFLPVQYAPGRTYNRSDSDLGDATIRVNGTLDASLGYIYTTSGGANIYSTGTGTAKINAGTQANTYQHIQGSDDTAIPITSAKLKNEDGSYLSTTSTTYNYDHHNCEHGDSATDGVWYAGEHDVVETVIAPTTTSKGYTSHTCACEHAYTDNEVPALVDGVIYGTNIRIGDTLDLHFYINRSVLDPLIQEGKTYKAVLTREYVNSEGNSDTSDKTYQHAEWEVYNSKYYRVSYDGFAAKEMTDDVHITIYEADTGYQVSETKTDSIRGYAVRSLKNTNNPEALRRTVIDMLNYGASAQEHFDYKTDDLANTGDSVIANNAEFATGEVTYVPDDISDNSADFYGLNISLKSDLYLNFYFKNVPTGSTATFTYVKHNGSKITDTIPYESFISTTADGVALTGIRVQGLGIADGRTKVTCTLSNGEKAIASIEGYVAETISPDKNPEKTLIAVCENLMKFIDSANAYFK